MGGGSASAAAFSAVWGGRLLEVGCCICTKLSGNMPRTPFSTPSHQPSSTCSRVSGGYVRGHGRNVCRWRVFRWSACEGVWGSVRGLRGVCVQCRQRGGGQQGQFAPGPPILSAALVVCDKRADECVVIKSLATFQHKMWFTFMSSYHFDF